VDEHRRRDDLAINLIEVNAHILGNHSTRSLLSLAAAASELRVPMTVASVNGFFPSTRLALSELRTPAVGGPSRGDLPARLYARGAVLADRCFNGLRRVFPRSDAPFQLLLIGRCLREAASLRMAHAATRGTHPVPVNVVQTASESLAASVAALSRVPHIRLVHEADHFEGPLLGLCEAVCRGRREDVVVVCTRESLKSRLRKRHPELRAIVKPFTLTDKGMRITEDERKEARRRLALEPDEVVAALVGGWWPYKDIATVERALPIMTERIVLLIVGGPTDDTVIRRMTETSKGRVIVFGKQVSTDDLRRVYAACNFSLVSRFPGTDKESGLVMDGARYGVPLVVSDSDPALKKLLEGHSWVRMFKAGDAVSLSSALDELVARPLERPGEDAPSLLEMMTPIDAIEFFGELGKWLLGGEPPLSPDGIDAESSFGREEGKERNTLLKAELRDPSSVPEVADATAEQAEDGLGT